MAVIEKRGLGERILSNNELIFMEINSKSKNKTYGKELNMSRTFKTRQHSARFPMAHSYLR